MSGGDVAPLEEQAVTELHKLFRRALVVFALKADQHRILVGSCIPGLYGRLQKQEAPKETPMLQLGGAADYRSSLLLQRCIRTHLITSRV